MGDFRTYGTVDGSRPADDADDALDALVNDPAISRIEAHSDLLFTRRHPFTRSDVELDFGGPTIRTDGVEANTHDNPFGAVMSFQDKVTGTKVTHTLTAAMPDQADVFEVGDSSAFAVGQW